MLDSWWAKNFFEGPMSIMPSYSMLYTVIVNGVRAAERSVAALWRQYCRDNFEHKVMPVTNEQWAAALTLKYF